VTLPRDAASHESMAIEAERTGFEWLDRPFMMTRIWLTLLATCFLAFFAYRIAAVLMFERLGPPPPPAWHEGPEESETVTIHGWGERRPFQA